ncbi:MAG: hypothetical protein QOJ03_497 [Frankiaceae bacterium]|jgi:hypothetical protein|nr:hypothetical protein [Frankiaceae bacterium]
MRRTAHAIGGTNSISSKPKAFADGQSQQRHDCPKMNMEHIQDQQSKERAATPRTPFTVSLRGVGAADRYYWRA